MLDSFAYNVVAIEEESCYRGRKSMQAMNQIVIFSQPLLCEPGGCERD